MHTSVTFYGMYFFIHFCLSLQKKTRPEEGLMPNSLLQKERRVHVIEESSCGHTMTKEWDLQLSFENCTSCLPSPPAKMDNATHGGRGFLN